MIGTEPPPSLEALQATRPGDGKGDGLEPGRADMLRTAAGLWVASDTYLDATSCGGRFHPGICFFPAG